MNQQYIELENFGGKTRLLRVDFNAVCEVEERFGKGIAAIFTEQQIGFNTLRIFYWAGLKWQDRGLTVERVAGWLQEEMTNGKDMQTLLEPIMKALKQAKILRDAQPDEEEKN